MTEQPNITVFDFITIPTQDLERSVEFCEGTPGLAKSVHNPEHGFAEFETGSIPLTIIRTIRV